MWTVFKRWLMTTFRFDREQRALLYQTMAAQLAAGVSAQAAFETLARTLRLSPELTRTAQSAAQAGMEGRGVTDGLAKTLPPDELGVLRIAERNNTLAEAFGLLQQRSDERLNLAAKVLLPNLYYLIMLTVLGFFATQAEDLLGVMGDPALLQRNPAYALSRWVNALWPPALAVLLGAAIMVIYGRSQWLDPWRRCLGVFDSDYRYRLGLRFCDFAAGLYAQGATHTEVLTATRDAHGQDRYVRWAVDAARRAHIEDGLAIEDALAGRLLPGRYAALLKGFVPNGERSRYPGGYRALATLLRVTLQKHYRAAAMVVRALTLTAIAALALTLARGIYGIFTALQSP